MFFKVEQILGHETRLRKPGRIKSYKMCAVNIMGNILEINNIKVKISIWNLIKLKSFAHQWKDQQNKTPPPPTPKKKHRLGECVCKWYDWQGLLSLIYK